MLEPAYLSTLMPKWLISTASLWLLDIQKRMALLVVAILR